MKTKIKRRSRGFTLVELVIVIAIVIILSVVSVPIYRGYIDKAEMTEAYALLSTCLSAQKAYYSEHGNFLAHYSNAAPDGYTNYHPILGIDARGNKYCTFFRATSSAYDWSKYFFSAAVYKPVNSRKEKKVLQLCFNITSGITFVEPF